MRSLREWIIIAVMSLTFFISSYFSWHYGRAPKELVAVGGNFLWFGYDYFSFALLTRTLFAPFRRIKDSYGRGFDPAVYAQAMIFNSVLRVVGMLMRLFIMAWGALFELVVFAGTALILVIWFLLPACIVGAFAYGILTLII